MIECAGDLYCLFETTQTFCVGGKCSSRNFDCDIAIQFSVTGAKHLTHATFADLRKSAVLRNDDVLRLVSLISYFSYLLVSNEKGIFHFLLVIYHLSSRKTM